VLLNHSDTQVSVNFLEYWETTQWVDQKGRLQQERKHFSWVTDYALYDSSAIELAKAGRTRWRIENETFNTLKNQGYEFEHNFGHGYKHLLTNMSMFMLLAFFCDQLQEMKCDLFRQAFSAVNQRRTRLFDRFKHLYANFPFQFRTWEMFLEMIVNPGKHIMLREEAFIT
jgi:hypothetical protein